MECCLSTNSQYIGKSAYSMNWTSVRINTHINGMWRADGPPCDKHFQNPGLNFNEHAKFTIIEKINNVSLPRQQRKRFLENREDFWILRFETLSLSKRSEHILTQSPRHNWFHLVKLFLFLLSLVSALFIRSFFKFLISRR